MLPNCLALIWNHFELKTFDNFYNGVYRDSRNLKEKPCLPQYRKVPGRFDKRVPTHQYQDPKERYCHAYFETLELATGVVERRFDQEDLHTIRKIEVLLLKAGNGKIVDSIPPVIQNYLKADFDQDRLKSQLSLVCDMIKSASQSGTVQVKKVTNVMTIAEAMNKNDIYKSNAEWSWQVS